MERKITARMLEWKNDSNRKPLLICGARQIGKTYSALHFGRTYYKNVAYFNFEFNRQASKIFENDPDTGRIIDSLSAFCGIDIMENDTLIIFDEIQACNRALLSLKYFKENDPGYHIIATGSLPGIASEREDFSFPVGGVNMLRMYPMNIEEFMLATGNGRIAEGIKKSFSSQKRYDLHDKAMETYRMYMAVGGLPEAVKSFSDGADASVITAIHADIDAAYMGDMSKHTSKAEAVMIKAIWSSIPNQLLKENKRFILKDVSEGVRTREAGMPLNWLMAAGLVNRCIRVNGATVPLSVHSEDPFFKLYMADTGLMASKLGIPYKMITSESPGIDAYKGALTENYVIQTLKANGIKTYYWAPSPTKEPDCIFQDSDGNIVPLEMKSSSHVKSLSMNAFMEKHKTKYAVRVSARNFGFDNRIFSVPLYAAFCITKDICDTVRECI